MKLANRKVVFRKFIALLRADPQLRTKVRPEGWYVWDGKLDENVVEFGKGQLPAIRITPVGRPASPESNVRQNSPLGIQVELAVDGLNLDVAIDTWEYIEGAIFTGDGSAAALRALQAVNPNVKGLRLGEPGITPRPQQLPDRVIYTAGSFEIDMLTAK